MSDELTKFVELAGRSIEVRKPNDGALVVLARISRGMPKDVNPAELSDVARASLVRKLGTIGTILESIIVRDEDRDWLDDVMVSGEVDTVEAFGLVTMTAKAFNSTTEDRPKAAVRRRAG